MFIITSCSVQKNQSNEKTLINVSDNKNYIDITTDITTESIVTEETKNVTDNVEENSVETNCEITIPEGISVLAFSEDEYSEKTLSLFENDREELSVEIENPGAELTKTLEFNGNTVTLQYENTIRTRYGETEIRYQYGENYESSVMFFDDGEICVIMGGLLKGLNIDLESDEEENKKILTGIFGGICDFDKYDSFAVKTIGDYMTVYKWYNDICGTVSYDRIEIIVLSDGSVLTFKRYAETGKAAEYKPDITKEQLYKIIETEKNKLLEKAGFSKIAVNKVEYICYGEYYISYKGKPAFEFKTHFYGVDQENEKRIQSFATDFVILLE